MSEIGLRKDKRLRCRRIMSGRVSTATPSSTIREAALILRDGDIGILPIVSGDGNLIGLVTDRDIVVRAVADGMDVSSTSVADIMTKELYTAKPDDFVFSVIRTMGERQVRRIPIVDDEGVLQGIISMADIALEIEDEKEVAEALEEISSGAAFWSKN